MNETKLLSIFGAKVSKDGTKLVLTLVSGEDESKQFYNACIKLDNSQKTRAKVEKDGKHALIKVVMLEDRQPKEKVNIVLDAKVENVIQKQEEYELQII